jgi:hypothetical protein
MVRAHIDRFESAAGDYVYTFPLTEYEWESSQGLRVPLAAAVGANYAHDFLGRSAAPKEPGHERVRVMLVEDSIDCLDTDWDAARVLVGQGLGKLWLVFHDGRERWAWARPASAPTLTVGSGQGLTSAMVAEFIRLSDWYGDDEITGYEDITESPHDWAIDYIEGTARTGLVEFVIKPLAAPGYARPQLENVTLSQLVKVDRVEEDTDDRIRIDNDRTAIEHSDDGGDTYHDDFANATLGGVQAGLIELRPGTNAMRFTNNPAGTPDWGYRSVVEGDSGSPATSLTISMPAGKSNGDLLFFYLATRLLQSYFNAPKGWTTLYQGSLDWLGYKIANGSEDTHKTWQWSQASHYTYALVTVYDSNGGTILLDRKARRYLSPGSNFQAPSITLSYDDDILFGVFSGKKWFGGASNTWTADGGMTERSDRQTGTDISFEIATEEITGSGATGTRTATPSASGLSGSATLVGFGVEPESPDPPNCRVSWRYRAGYH